MRKFALVNSLGDRYELTDKLNKVFLNGPEGLGFTKEIVVENYELSDDILSERYLMPQVSGEMIFHNDLSNAYADYLSFADFIANKPLKLEYLPPNAIDPFYIECTVSIIEKSEMNYDDKVIHCPIVFNGTTLWRKNESNRLLLQKQTDESGKYYDLVRPYYYQSSSFTDVDIDVRADLSLPFELYITGSVTNPQLTVSQNDIQYGIIKLNGTFDSVYINTDDRDEQIKLTQNGSVLANPYNYQDYSVADGSKLFTFFNLRVGNNHITFSCQNLSSFNGTVELVWKDMRATL